MNDKEAEDSFFEEICLLNGLETGKSDYPDVERLDILLSSYSCMPCLVKFSQIKILCFLGLPLQSISNLSQLFNLTELWISDCKLTRLNGLECNTKLKRLYLYGNYITKIEGLDKLIDLELLWLNGNKINKIEHLEQLINLKDLNLAENQITELEASLCLNENLERINFSGNYLASLKELNSLTCLTQLKHISFKDPIYQPSPVSQLCNYTTYVLYHFPNLLTLDTHDVASKVLKDLAEETVKRKKSYYQMSKKSLLRKYKVIEHKLHLSKDKLLSSFLARKKRLMFGCKEIERELSDLSSEDGSSKCEDDTDSKLLINSNHQPLLTKLNQIKDRINEINDICQSEENLLANACYVTSNQLLLDLVHLETEFQSGGNIQFEEGHQSMPWYCSCQDLIQARFCASDFKDLGVTGLRVHRIVRVQNRILKTKFDKKLEHIKRETNDIEEQSSSDDYKDMDYLFYVWDPTFPNANAEHQHVIEQGFRSSQMYQRWGSHAALHLSNSVNVCDKPRIKSCIKQSSERLADKPAVCHGQLIVCKTFVGKTAQVNHHKRILPTQYPGYNSAFKMRRHSLSLLKSCSNEVLRSSTRCDCNSKRASFYLFDSDLALPEYIVYFEYLTKNSPAIYNTMSTLLSSCTIPCRDMINAKEPLSLLEMTDDNDDDDILLNDPCVRSRPRLTVLTEDALMKHCNVVFLSRITLEENIFKAILRNNALYLQVAFSKIINLMDSGLSNIKQLSSLNSLKEVVVAFNGLTSLKDISGMPSLVKVDASFNKISTLNSFRCESLTEFNVSWNDLKQTRDEVNFMGKYLPSISILNTSHNPWDKISALRMCCVSRLRHLAIVDDIPVTEEEVSKALRRVASSRIAHVSILANSRMNHLASPSLSLSSHVTQLMKGSVMRPTQIGQEDTVWLSNVTCLCLDNQHLSKLSNLDQLHSLKWASFNNNDITKIEGLSCCCGLEELSLINNNIAKLEGLESLHMLKWLDLGQNKITSLDSQSTFNSLRSLEMLSLEMNQILSLKGIENARKIQELYLADNMISCSFDILNLKSISSLVVFDLTGNPVAKETDNYRLFVIYHLSSLKALDGTPVDLGETSSAQDVFGGRMTQDFVAEQLNHSSFEDVAELDLCGNALTIVDLSPETELVNLMSLNLEANNLVSFGGLIHLKQLKVLCLNHNRIETILQRTKGTTNDNKPYPGTWADNRNEADPEILPKLEVLHLGYNGIVNISLLKLHLLKNLKALFLQGNEILKVEGLESNHELRELVLDKNKIKAFSEMSFFGQKKLKELHIEENRLKDLTYINQLKNLQRLYIGLNRIQDAAELENLCSLTGLIEISLIGNTVTRRLQHRPLLVFRIPSLLCIDGIPVTSDERVQAEMYFVEQQNGIQLVQSLANGVDALLPGIQMSPLKVSTVKVGDKSQDWPASGRRLGVDPFTGLSPPLQLNAEIADLARVCFEIRTTGLGRNNETKGSYTVPYVPHSCETDRGKPHRRHNRKSKKD